MIFFALAGAAFLIHTVYWLLLRRGFRRAEAQARADPGALPPLSVIVAARDEEQALPALLAALSRQEYPEFEVVVVDDASEDATAEIARAFAAADGRVRLVTVEDPQPPRKKHALTAGIAHARYEHLALTDADCTPPPLWLEAVGRHHGRGAASPRLLLGYSPFRKRPGLLNLLARYETFIVGYYTAAAAGLGRPYMAVGRNIAYTRSLFEQIGGFAHSRQSLSGDDDLLVQEVARRRAAEVVHLFDPRGHVTTDAPETWRSWVRQKMRHTSASRFYARDVQLHLAVFHTTGLLLWVAPLFLGWPGLILLLTSLLVRWTVLAPAFTALNERDLSPKLPLLELLYAAYNLLLAPLGVLRMPKRW